MTSMGEHKSGDLSVFEAFPKIRRASQNGVIITEKIDGTNAQISIHPDGRMWFGSRNRWVTPGPNDNFGFAAWCEEHREELLQLGPGRHYGEWWGSGIQRGYGLAEKRLSLFNTWRPADTLPACVSQVPILYEGEAKSEAIDLAFARLLETGSVAAPGFMRPEGIIIYHHLSRTLIKRTYDGDKHKGQEPKTPTLEQTLAGAERARQRVAAWPEWKRKISTATHRITHWAPAELPDPPVVKPEPGWYMVRQGPVSLVLEVVDGSERLYDCVGVRWCTWDNYEFGPRVERPPWARG